MVILAALFGALMNRIRGGQVFPRPTGLASRMRGLPFVWSFLHTSTGTPRARDFVNAMAFGGFVWIVLKHWESGAFAALAMALGSSLGWGRYIGALGGWENRRLEEVVPIDWLISGWKPESKPIPNKTIFTHEPKWKLQLWGLSGLCLRGMLWGAALTLPIIHYIVVFQQQDVDFNIFIFPLYAGVTMPLAYTLALVTAIVMKRPDWQGKTTEYGEIYYGLALWGGWYYLFA